jgi:hypothetical protein
MSPKLSAGTYQGPEQLLEDTHLFVRLGKLHLNKLTGAKIIARRPPGRQAWRMNGLFEAATQVRKSDHPALFSLAT